MKWFHGFALIISGEILITLIFYLTVGSFDLPHPKAVEDEQYADGLENPIMVSKLYDYYNIEAGMASSGLSTGADSFLLNGKRLTILSGALHYFRVHPAHWRDRLRKLRAMGCNTVETYIPWNLHEPEKDVYDFGVEEYKTDYQFSEWLNVVQFIEMAEEEDLFVIIRPGPYIGADWDFGGLPSYLLSIPGLKVRTNDDLYLDRVDKYFETLLPRLAPLTVERGGPIIMFQIENEYGYFSNSSESNEHLEYLQMKMESLGINSFFSTCDDVALVGRAGSLVEKGVLMTATFQDNVEHELSTLRELQPYRPAMVMEFSSGRIDHWGQTHTTRSELDYSKKLFYIISFPASINLYLFHGGTNFGFMSGANQWVSRDRIIYEPSTTSYDRDALLTENGDYTKKYFLTRELFVDVQKFFGIYVPDPPKIEQMLISPAIEPLYQMDYMDIIGSIPSDHRILSDQLIPMELLPLKSKMRTGEMKGQSYGYTLYRIFLPVEEDPEIQIFGRVNDTVILLVDGKRFTDVMRSAKQMHDFGFWRACKYEYDKKKINLPNGTYTFDFLVENMGRNSMGFTLEDFDQKKGLSQGSVTISGLQPEGIWGNIYSGLPTQMGRKPE
ncbi:beta-galactosidase-1-like protein 2 [Nilaparvata lugens]|uniref:beta-galactosidase-1-like protein 2 n=1 Tax=Nilaparvata lugens TaxID=108931 RepID=UPI00193E336A|nr:beta-galactosidase-1-like protein 2 [Nilaparvata lugens]